MLSVRKISAAGFTYRHFSRYRQIIAVLIKYGFDDILGILRVEKYIGILVQVFSKKGKELVINYSRAQRFRMALEELGPTFIKLGQALSMRPDFLSSEYIDELSKLQDKVPPCSFPEVADVIRIDFGNELHHLFDSFEEIPLASASIGQVHKARLKGGKEVAVKVQRPGIENLILVDLGIMYHLASLSEKKIEEFSFIRPVKIVEEFVRTITRELDYILEANHMERFANNFSHDPTVRIPKIYRKLITKRVLTMEFIHGIKASDTKHMEKAGLDKKLITHRGAQMLLKQIFDHGFFHSDPHAGNIFILPNHIIALLDFGQVGAVDQQSKEDFVDLIDSVIHQNSFKATRQLLKITFWDKEPDIRLLEKEVAGFISTHLYRPLKDLDIGLLLQDLLQMVSRFQLRIPPDIFLMMKALATIEGIARKLDPDFDMITQSSPFIKQIKLARVKPQRIAEDVYTLSGEVITFIKQLPSDMMEISRLIREHKLSLRIDEKNMEQLLQTQVKTGNRISISILIAALVIFSAIAATSEMPMLIFGMLFVGLTVTTLATVILAWILVWLIRNR